MGRPREETQPGATLEADSLIRRVASAPGATTPERIGQVIGDYRIIGLLGHGGMGHVYEAEDTKHARRVAVKFLRPGLAERPQERERFLRSAR